MIQLIYETSRAEHSEPTLLDVASYLCRIFVIGASVTAVVMSIVLLIVDIAQ